MNYPVTIGATCPACKAEDAIAIKVEPGDYSEIREVRCGCTLSPAEREALEQAAWEQAYEDAYEGRP